MTIRNIIIIGQGPAGLTAAIYAARAGYQPLLLTSPTDMGQLEQTTEVGNFPGFPEGIMGPELVENMKKQAMNYGAEMQTATVEKISGNGPFTLQTSTEELKCRSILIATGARPRRMGLESETRLWGHGVTACATCDGFFYRNKKVAVLGGGDSACEEALVLTKFASEVTLVHRRDQLRASKIMADKVLSHPKIKVIWNAIVEEIIGDTASGVSGLKLKDKSSSEINTIPLDGVFISIGHVPNTAFLKDFIELDPEGYVILKKGMMTSVPGIFAAGDVHDHKYRQAISSAGFGCQAALEMEHWLEQNPA
jgi:thioredoxin reductase (NADPH)